MDFEDTDPVTLPVQLQTLVDLVSENPDSFANGSEEIQEAALGAVKFVFDLSLQSEPTSLPHITEFLSFLDTSTAPQTRSQAKNNDVYTLTSVLKCKPFPPTELSSLYTDGMDEDQIWAQLDLRAQRVSKMLEIAVQEESICMEEFESDDEDKFEGEMGNEDESEEELGDNESEEEEYAEWADDDDVGGGEEVEEVVVVVAGKAEKDSLESAEEDTEQVAGDSVVSSTLRKKRKHIYDGDQDEGDEDLVAQQTMGRLNDDLFAEEEEADFQTDLSSHEKRLAALKEQIATLEAENVGQKDWTMLGEAVSRSRPENSALEQDLEFDRNLKPTPVITTEAVQALEDRIKARILEGDFDDVVRRRVVEDKTFLPSRCIDLKDTKDKEGLAKSYEDEYLAAQGVVGVGDDRDGKLAKEHHELETLWEAICCKLDALCNAHYTPKQPKITISSVQNVATTSLESALQSTQSTSSMLAPEEIFTPDSSISRSRSEMTPSEKKAARAKERKKKKKMRDVVEGAKQARRIDNSVQSKRVGGIKKAQKKALESIVKSGKGVTVVGKTPDKDGRRRRAK